MNFECCADDSFADLFTRKCGFVLWIKFKHPYLCKSVFICGKCSAALHLPVFDKLGWNFFQESRGPLKNVAVAAAQAHVRISEIELVFSARDRDIKQASLFFEGI